VQDGAIPSTAGGGFLENASRLAEGDCLNAVKAILLADGHLQISARSCSDCASTGEENEAHYGKDNEHADYREKPSQIDANAAVEIWLASAKQIHGAAIDVVSKLLVPGRDGILVIGRHGCSLLED